MGQIYDFFLFLRTLFSYDNLIKDSKCYGGGDILEWMYRFLNTTLKHLNN